MRKLFRFSGVFSLALVLLLSFPLAALAADSADVDNDVATNAGDNSVDLSASPGATVNTNAQLVVKRGGGRTI